MNLFDSVWCVGCFCWTVVCLSLCSGLSSIFFCVIFKKIISIRQYRLFVWYFLQRFMESIEIIIIIITTTSTTTTITYSYYLFNILVFCVCVFVPEIFVPEYKLNEIYFTTNSIFCSQWPWLNHIFLVVRLIYEQKTRHQIHPKRSLNIYSWAAELAPCQYMYWWQYFPYRKIFRHSCYAVCLIVKRTWRRSRQQHNALLIITAKSSARLQHVFGSCSAWRKSRLLTANTQGKVPGGFCSSFPWR